MLNFNWQYLKNSMKRPASLNTCNFFTTCNRNMWFTLNYAAILRDLVQYQMFTFLTLWWLSQAMLHWFLSDSWANSKRIFWARWPWEERTESEANGYDGSREEISSSCNADQLHRFHLLTYISGICYLFICLLMYKHWLLFRTLILLETHSVAVVSLSHHIAISMPALSGWCLALAVLNLGPGVTLYPFCSSTCLVHCITINCSIFISWASSLPCSGCLLFSFRSFCILKLHLLFCIQPVQLVLVIFIWLPLSFSYIHLFSSSFISVSICFLHLHFSCLCICLIFFHG